MKKIKGHILIPSVTFCLIPKQPALDPKGDSKVTSNLSIHFNFIKMINWKMNPHWNQSKFRLRCSVPPAALVWTCGARSRLWHCSSWITFILVYTKRGCHSNNMCFFKKLENSNTKLGGGGEVGGEGDEKGIGIIARRVSDLKIL